MFDTLTDKFGQIFDRLTRRGALSEADVDGALRELRVSLIEADVALPVIKDFLGRVRPRAIGQEVLRSVTPGQMMIKIVHDELVATLGAEESALDLAATPPVVILMLGLQGSGKTTTTAKLGLRLQTRDKKKVLMASLDVARPAAQEQLKVLGEQAGVSCLPVVAGQMPVEIAKRAVQAARLGGFDVVLLDSAGRGQIDEALMAELAAVRDATSPRESLLVADALTGQDAVNVAKGFHERIGVTGIVLTRLDGDGRGGAALSMRAVTGRPIKFAGIGEKLDQLDVFDPRRVAGRLLGQGDVVGLVEKAAASIEEAEAEKLAAKLQKGQFDLEDMAAQFRQIRKMGGMGGLMGMLPGVAKAKKQMAEAKIDESVLKRQEAIIGSMTKTERRSPKIIGASRKRRIAAGSGTEVSEVNRVLKQHLQMADMMKRMQKMNQSGRLASGLASLFGQQKF